MRKESNRKLNRKIIKRKIVGKFVAALDSKTFLNEKKPTRMKTKISAYTAAAHYHDNPIHLKFKL